MTPPCVECKNIVIRDYTPLLGTWEQGYTSMYQCKTQEVCRNHVTGIMTYRGCSNIRSADCEMFKPKLFYRIVNWFRRRK